MVFVTRHNWGEASGQAVSHLEQATFVAIDCEMSGVQAAAWRSGSQVDTLCTRYLNLRDSASKFGLLQFGLCPFVWDAAASKYRAYPYNFCLFPRNELPIQMPARDFLCQATSLEFLAQHKFDFNACIHDGISFLSRQDEEEARSKLILDSDHQSEEDEIPLTSTADVLFSQKVRVDVGQWRDQVLHADKRGELVLQLDGKHQVRLVHQVLRKNFIDLVAMTLDTGPKHAKVQVLLPRSTKEKAALLAQWEEDKRKKLEAQVLEAVGFRRIIDALVSSRKPIVGHNCFLDLAHIYCKFFAPLPPSCADFCSSLRQHFGCIVDTKYVLKTYPEFTVERRTSTSLGAVYELLKDKTAQVEMTFSRYAHDADLKHEAGYDAYMTGVVFANICGVLKMDHSHPNCANLLNLGWRSWIVLDVTNGKEVSRSKSSAAAAAARNETTALLQGCCRFPDLEKHVKDSFFKGAPSFEILPVEEDDDSAFLIFKRKTSLDAFLEAFEAAGGRGDMCNVNKLLSTGLRIARFETFENLCQSPLSTRKLGDALDLVTQMQSSKRNAAEAGAEEGEAAEATGSRKKRARGT